MFIIRRSFNPGLSASVTSDWDDITQLLLVLNCILLVKCSLGVIQWWFAFIISFSTVQNLATFLTNFTSLHFKEAFYLIKAGWTLPPPLSVIHSIPRLNVQMYWQNPVCSSMFSRITLQRKCSFKVKRWTAGFQVTANSLSSFFWGGLLMVHHCSQITMVMKAEGVWDRSKSINPMWLASHPLQIALLLLYQAFVVVCIRSRPLALSVVALFF